MRVKVTIRNCKITQEEKRYIRQKVRKLDKFSTKIDHADIIIKMERYQYVMEFIVKTSTKSFLVKRRGAKVKEVADILADKMEYQLSKYKEKLKAHHKREKRERPVVTSRQERVQVVINKIKDIPLISQEGAIEILEDKGYTIFLYKDESIDRICVLTKIRPNKYEILQT
jgi:putative sigma-54 modulation protein